MVLISSRIPNKDKENAHMSYEGTTKGPGSVPRKRTHAHVIQPKTRLVPTRTENLCSLLREICTMTKKSPKGAALLRKLSLPKVLRRPVFRPIAPQCLAAVDPGLAAVPLEYIQRGFRDKSERLYNATLKIVPKQNDGALSRTLEIRVLDDSVELPTHILAVYSTPEGISKKQISLHPAHSIVLASQCAHLPPVVPATLSSSSSSPGNQNSLALPVLPMCLPSPRTFPLLLRYLYAHQTSEILSALLPFPTQSLSVVEISSKLVSACNVPTLLSLISVVHGLWGNVAALGIFEDSLWKVLDFSWEVLLKALESKTKTKDVL